MKKRRKLLGFWPPLPWGRCVGRESDSQDYRGKMDVRQRRPLSELWLPYRKAASRSTTPVCRHVSAVGNDLGYVRLLSQNLSADQTQT